MMSKININNRKTKNHPIYVDNFFKNSIFCVLRIQFL